MVQTEIGPGNIPQDVEMAPGARVPEDVCSPISRYEATLRNDIIRRSRLGSA